MSDFNHECKAAYLTVCESTRHAITALDDLYSALYQSGRSPTKQFIKKYWRANTKEIDFEEFLNICYELPVTTKNDLIAAFKHMDLNNDGFITRNEFLKAMTTVLTVKSRIIYLSIIYAHSHTHKHVCIFSYVHIMTQKGERMTMEEVTSIIDQVDRNKDGKLDFEEFSKLILSNVNESKKMARDKMNQREMQSSSKSRSIDSYENEADSYSYGAQKSALTSSSRKSMSNADEEKRKNKPDLIISKIFGGKFEYREPRTIGRWQKMVRRGVFVIDDDSPTVPGIQAHQVRVHSYVLTVTQSPANILITMHGLDKVETLERKPIDLGLLLVKDNEVLAIAEQADANGMIFIKMELPKGVYRLLPFTTGAKFTARNPSTTQSQTETKLINVNTRTNEIKLTNEFRKALEDIFYMNDLNCSQTWGRNEYNIYSKQICEDGDIDDKYWSQFRKSIGQSNEEINAKDFIKSILMEAKDEDGDSNNLWAILENLGFNKQLKLDEGYPFTINIYNEMENTCSIKVSESTNEVKMIRKFLASFVIRNGEKLKWSENSNVTSKECNVYAWTKGVRMILAAENLESPMRGNSINLAVDCEKSTNLITMEAELINDVDIKAGQQELLFHGIAYEPKVSISLDCKITRNF